MDKNSSDTRVLLLVPDIAGVGGVTNYYRVLDLPKYGNVHYFFVNTPEKQSSLQLMFRLCWNYLKFMGRLLTQRYDLVHINPSLNRNSFYRDALFALIAKLFGKKVLIFFRGWEDSYEAKIKTSSFQQWLFNNSIAKANKFVVLGDIFRRKLIGLGVPESSSFVIETTVADSGYLSDLDLEAKLEKFRNREINFLFLSRILEQKGIYIALDIYKTLCEEYPDHKLSFTVAGSGPELDKSRAYVEEHHIPNVVFTGHVQNEEKKEVLLKAQIFLFPTYYGEGLPNSILEAMLYGQVIISRINAGIPDVVGADGGFITESKQPEDYLPYLRDLLVRPDTYKQIAFANHRTATEKFTSEKVRTRILDLYQSFKRV